MTTTLREIFAIGNTIDFSMINDECFNSALVIGGDASEGEIQYQILTPEFGRIGLFLSNVKNAQKSLVQRNLLSEIGNYKRLQEALG